ncbi:MAG: 50S ribosomal protein L35 [Planctomycetota bacterium]
MPKQKTHKASQRRVRITKNGKILRRQCGVRHLMTNRSPKTKRQLRQSATTTTPGYRRKFIAGHCGV